MDSSILLAAVLATHLSNSWLLSRAVGLRGDDRFWGVILGTFAQWGTLATVLSLAHALTRNGWLAGLAVITIAAVTVAAVTSAPRRVEMRRAGPRRRSGMVAT